MKFKQDKIVQDGVIDVSKKRSFEWLVLRSVTLFRRRLSLQCSMHFVDSVTKLGVPPDLLLMQTDRRAWVVSLTEREQCTLIIDYVV